MVTATPITVNVEKHLVLESQESQGWARMARPGSMRKRKHFMASCDTHLNTSPKSYIERLHEKWHRKLPRIGQPLTERALDAYLEMLQMSGLVRGVPVLGGDVVETGMAQLALER